MRTKEAELQVGDIIFFENNYIISESGALDYKYIDHVAIFAGFNTEGHPQIIHSISRDLGHYHPQKLSGLCTTTLRALKNQVQREPGFPDVGYHVNFYVFRSNLHPTFRNKLMNKIPNMVYLDSQV